jgi:hypothetical protein
MHATYDPKRTRGCLMRVAAPQTWLEADGWLGQDREDGISIATPRLQGLRMRLATAHISERPSNRCRPGRTALAAPNQIAERLGRSSSAVWHHLRRPALLGSEVTPSCDVVSSNRAFVLFSHVPGTESRLPGQGLDIHSCASLHAGVRWQ